MTISTVTTDARIKELCGLMRERFSMNPVSCNILNEEWKASFPSEPDIAKAMLSLLSRATTAEAKLLAVREVQPLGFTHRSEISNMQATGLYLRAWPVDRRLNEQEGYTIPLYTAPPAPAPAVPADYQHLKHVSESYFSVEKRLFDLAQRLKGSSFDHYAYSLNQAIDVLDKEIFGEGEDNSALLAAAPNPTKAGE